MSDKKTEYIDIVDEEDTVIRERVSRAEALQHSLCSRISIVMLVDENNHDVLIQRRSTTASFKPNAYCSSVCGYVLSGETMEQGARREMIEEMGVNSSLSFLEKTLFTDNEIPNMPKSFMLGVYYALVNKNDIQIDPREVASYGFYALDDAMALLNNSTDMLHTMLKPSLEILQKNWQTVIA